jgi:hypothetical protein
VGGGGGGCVWGCVWGCVRIEGRFLLFCFPCFVLLLCSMCFVFLVLLLLRSMYLRLASIICCSAGYGSHKLFVNVLQAMARISYVCNVAGYGSHK